MNWSECFYMGGYGFYVWGSYLATLLLLGFEVLLLIRRRRALLGPRQSAAAEVQREETPLHKN